MSLPASLALFLADAAAAGLAAWWLARAAQPGAAGVLEPAVAWLLACLILVAGSAAVLGLVGFLGPPGFLVTHVIALGAAAILRRRQLGVDGCAARDLVRELRARMARGDTEGRATAALVTVLLALAVLAAAGEPLVYDALAYRLPRIGQWLEEGFIRPIATDDQRLNYMASGADLVVAWLVGAFPTGFRLAALAQTMGGALLLGATIGLARVTGLMRTAALGAAALVLGMANVAPQFTSVHTDLFAAGVFAAAFWLWLAAVRRGEGSALAGAGAAYALAAKGTVFYLLPAALLWSAWLAWSCRPAWRTWRVTGLSGLAAAALFLGPPFARNHQVYGHLTAPVEAMREHYGPALSVGQRLDRLQLNLCSAAAQGLEPNSQPWGLRDLAAGLAGRIVEALPAADPYTFDQLDRQANLRYYLQIPQPNPDFAGPGLWIGFLFACGMIAAIARWRDAASRKVILWGVGVGAYFIVQCGLLQWHPWTFRYLVLVAPWLAIVAAWGLEQMNRPLRAAFWAFSLAAGAILLLESTFEGDQVGWRAWTAARDGTAIASGWEDWTRNLGREANQVVVALPGDRPLARFFRLDPNLRVRLASFASLASDSAEAAVGQPATWLVVPAARFAGREGRVVARTWLHHGDAADDLSLAAYRQLRAGEQPEPVIYRNVIRAAGAGFQLDLLLRSWSGRTGLEVVNSAGTAWTWVARSDAGEVRGELEGASGTIALATRPDGLTRLTIALLPKSGAKPGLRPPVVVGVHPVVDP